MERNTEQVLDLESRKVYLLLSFILLMTFFSYLPVFQNNLLNWDDDGYIKYNSLIQSFNLKGIFMQNIMGNWHPLTILILAIEYHYFGLNPVGYHAVNLLLHLLNVILVFCTIRLVSDRVVVALIASLLFGIHPLHVESVAWAAELKDLLYTSFFLGCFIFYLKFIHGQQKKHYFFSLLLFLFSLLSKAMAASLPLILILTDFYKGRKINKKTLVEKIPFFLIAIIIGVIAINAQGPDVEIATFPKRIVFACYGFVSYLIKLAFPMNLMAFYSYPLNNKIPILYYFYGIAFIAIITAIIYSHLFSKRIIFGMGFFVITILPVLQLLPIGDAIMADRYSYIPSIGVFFLAGEGFILMWRGRLKFTGVILLTLFTVFFSIKTYARCGVWKSDLTLWNDVIDQDKTVEEAYFLRGVSFANEGMIEEAIKDFSKAIELKPRDAVAYYNRGAAFVDEKRYGEALNDFNKAIELKPDCVPAYVNRAIFFGMRKKYEEAISDLNRAIELKPDFAVAYYNRGIISYFSGKSQDACKDLNIALNLGYEEAKGALLQICK